MSQRPEHLTPYDRAHPPVAWWRTRWFRGVLALVLLLAMAAYWTLYARA